MRSQSTSEERRCETITIVRPRAMRLRMWRWWAPRFCNRRRCAHPGHELKIGDHRPCDGKALALPARKVGRALLDPGAVALRQALDKLLGGGEPGRAHHIFETEAVAPGENVVLDRAAEQEVFLEHNPEALAQMTQVDVAQLHSIDFYRTRIFAADTHEQPGNGGFAGARAADQSHYHARLDGEADPVKMPGVFVPSYLKVASSKPIAPSNFGRNPSLSARFSVGRF